jgi:hypothetical protein
VKSKECSQIEHCEAEQRRIIWEFERGDASDLLLFLMGWADWEIEKELIRAASQPQEAR